MSEENIAVVRKGLDAFNAFMRGELSSDRYAVTFDPEVELRWPEQRIYPDAPQHLRGVSELIEFTERFRDGWVDLVAEPLEIEEMPDGRILALIRQSGRGKGSGVPISIHFFGLWTIRDGEVSRVEYFRHRADALEAAGMRE
jgi:ketosteroid isomerase-like protein